MSRNAFTLIEVMVVMAIISILAGMMTPMVWTWWESQQIETTRQRLKELKLAMIGDRTLVQNGVRTHYGFVGDFGELPFDNNSSCAFNFLNSKDALAGSTRYNSDNWGSRYLPSSADVSNYSVDAWGNPIKCVNKVYKDDRWVALTLQSTAPGGDVLEEVILESDVTPTNRVTGNVIGNNDLVNTSIKIRITPVKSGVFTVMSTCKQLNGSSASYLAELPYKFPIGRMVVELNHSKNSSNCSTETLQNKFNYFMHDNLNEVSLPSMNVNIP